MAELNLRLEVRLSPVLARWGLVAAILACPVAELGSETVTLTTYYPAPSGVYTRMITTNDTFLARDGGRVGIGTTNAAAGSNGGKLTVASSGGAWTDGISLRLSGSNNAMQMIHDSAGRMGVGYNGGAILGIHSNGGMSIGAGAWSTPPTDSNSLVVQNNLVVQNRAKVLVKLLAGFPVAATAPSGSNFQIEAASAIRARQTGCTLIQAGTACGGYVTLAEGFYATRMVLPLVPKQTGAPGAPNPNVTTLQPQAFFCCTCTGGCNPD